MQSKSISKTFIRIAVLESDPLRFIGLRALLESEADFELSLVPLDQIESTVVYDVVLIAERRDVNVYELIENLKARQPAVRIIVAGQSEDDETVLKALCGGAKGYVNENALASEFAQAIRVAAQGLIWASRRIVSLLIDRSSGVARRKFMPDPLTSREKQVLEMLVAGRSNKEIAAPLGIEERTVKAHVAKLMRKLGVQNRIKLSVHAITHCLVTAK